MAISYPYTTEEKSIYIAGVPFSDTSTSSHAQINGSQWDHCKITINSFTNNILTGALYFEVTTRRQGYPMSSNNIGTSYGPYAKQYWTSVAYSLVFSCYDSNNNFIGSVIPINQRTIYQVSTTTESGGKMYNWRTQEIDGDTVRVGKTCEPWVIRYPSDVAGNLYNMLPIYYDSYAKFRYNNRTNLTRSYFSNNGWLDFSIALPQNTSYFAVDIQVYSKPNSTSSTPPAYQLKGTINLYTANVDPIIVDNPSKLQYKPLSSSTWSNNGMIWYKKANSTTWERKYIYKKSASSTTWNRI